VVFSSQSFTAPTLDKKPKLGKKMISSSVFRGAFKSIGKSTTIKIPKGMQIGASKSYVDPSYLRKEESTPIEQTLVETNNILIEIQNQLATDFAYRIAKEKEDIQKIKITSDKEKKSRAEAGVESVKKIGGFVKNQVDKVTTPVKGFFQKILDFFGAIITGFVVNKAIDWLTKPGNAEKIAGIFTFIGKHWKPILAVIGGFLLTNVVLKIYRLYKLIRGALRLIGIGRRGAGAGAGDAIRRGGLIRNAAGGRRGVNVEMERITRAKPGSGGLLHERVDVYKRTKNPVAKAVQKAEVLSKLAGKKVVKALGAKGLMKFLRPVFKRVPVFGALIDFAVSLALGEPIGRAAAKSVGMLLGSALGTLIPIPGVGTFAGGLLGDFVGGKIYDAIVGEKQEDPLKMNRGGIVPGPNINKDIVPILATPGEAVVPKKETARFSGFLSDIISNGGELFEKMFLSLRKQEYNNNIFKEANEKFEESIEVLSKYFKKETLKALDPNLYNKLYGAIGGPRDSMTNKSLNPVKKNTSNMSMRSMNRSPSITMLPPISAATNLSASKVNSTPSGGDSIIALDAEDNDNFYVSYYTASSLGLGV